MKLCEHEDFGALLVATADSRGLNEQFVEEDYYLTEVVRIVAATYGDRVIFKGLIVSRPVAPMRTSLRGRCSPIMTITALCARDHRAHAGTGFNVLAHTRTCVHSIARHHGRPRG